MAVVSPTYRGGVGPGPREVAGTRLSRSGQVPGPTVAGSRRTYLVPVPVLSRWPSSILGSPLPTQPRTTDKDSTS